MKKKYLAIITMAALGALIGIGFNTQSQGKFSDITLANAEAIASGESGSKGPGEIGNCNNYSWENDRMCWTTTLDCWDMNDIDCSPVVCREHEGYNH